MAAAIPVRPAKLVKIGPNDLARFPSKPEPPDSVVDGERARITRELDLTLFLSAFSSSLSPAFTCSFFIKEAMRSERLLIPAAFSAKDSSLATTLVCSCNAELISASVAILTSSIYSTSLHFFILLFNVSNQH